MKFFACGFEGGGGGGGRGLVEVERWKGRRREERKGRKDPSRSRRK